MIRAGTGSVSRLRFAALPVTDIAVALAPCIGAHGTVACRGRRIGRPAGNTLSPHRGVSANLARRSKWLDGFAETTNIKHRRDRAL
jgi:hypothetical protein